MIYVKSLARREWDSRTERRSVRKAKIKEGVRERYAEIAGQDEQCSCSCS